MKDVLCQNDSGKLGICAHQAQEKTFSLGELFSLEKDAS